MRGRSSGNARRWRSWTSGSARGPNSGCAIFYRNKRTKQSGILGATDNFAAVNFAKLEMGRFFNDGEVQRRRNVVVLGQGPFLTLFDNVDPIGKKVRIGTSEFTVIGVVGKRPSPGGFNTGADDFAVVPYTTHEKMFGSVGTGASASTDGRSMRARSAAR